MGALVKQQVNCAICGANDYTVTLEPNISNPDPKMLYGAASGVKGTQRLVRCNSCGFIYENPRYPDAVILNAYAESQEAEHDSQYNLRAASFLKTLNSLKSLIPGKGAKILDVGTAGGAFLMAAQQFGYEATGIEPSLQLCEQAKRRGLKVVTGVLTESAFPQKSFDLICLWDVLEHVTDPIQILNICKLLLKDTGILLINYPDIGTWQAKLAGKKFWWILSVHLFHFDRKTIARACQRAGFKVFHQSAYWQTLEFGYLMDVAAQLGVPFVKLIKKLMPSFILKLPFSYYASQTTALAQKDLGLE